MYISVHAACMRTILIVGISKQVHGRVATVIYCFVMARGETCSEAAPATRL